MAGIGSGPGLTAETSGKTKAVLSPPRRWIVIQSTAEEPLVGTGKGSRALAAFAKAVATFPVSCPRSAYGIAGGT